ncbi:hypothetical protein L2D00_03925 [Hyphomonadaceae bacterium BL14]|nr:hypothetical protein L2D00_03925 [Hyphomonadaceae bacterium BL14]
MGARQSWDGDFDEAVKRAQEIISASLSRDISVAELFIYRHYFKTAPDKLLELSDRSEADHLAVLKVLAENTEMDAPLPEIIRRWIADYLRGSHPRPTKRQGRPSDTGLRVAIWDAVQELVERLGMTATRNEASEETSACDAVAQALSNLELKPTSFDRVKKIWVEVSRAIAQADRDLWGEN